MKRIVPDATQMRRYVEAGLNQTQIVERYEEETGIRCSRSAIGMAMARYDLKSPKPRPRFDDLLPWVISNEDHRMKRDARMLRLEGRRRRGIAMSDKELRLLTTWLGDLKDADAVVAYNPNSEPGFFWVPKREGEDLVRVEPIV